MVIHNLIFIPNLLLQILHFGLYQLINLGLEVFMRILNRLIILSFILLDVSLLLVSQLIIMLYHELRLLLLTLLNFLHFISLFLNNHGNSNIFYHKMKFKSYQLSQIIYALLLFISSMKNLMIMHLLEQVNSIILH
jgi:hypothetical protein